MAMTLVLPWFPIVLAAGVGGRLLGCRRGLSLGVACAMFWVVLVQASAGIGVWQDGWTIMALLSGSMAIAGMGAWSGSPSARVDTLPATDAQGITELVGAAAGRHGGVAVESAAGTNPARVRSAPWVEVSEALARFDDWLAQYRDVTDPWSAFDEFLRQVLRDCCQASYVKTYRLSAEGDLLVPLREIDPLRDPDPIPAREGIVGHVLATRQAYVAGGEGDGPILATLQARSSEPVACCFPITRAGRACGVVVVGRLGIDAQRHPLLLTVIARLVNQFWTTLHETVCSRHAEHHDPVSGLLIRPAFMRAAQPAIVEAHRHGEPVALAIFGIEGLRDLNDSGGWEAADELVRELADALRCKVRADDRLGRFDGARFVLLLRRVDADLGALIVRQLLARMQKICAARRMTSARSSAGTIEVTVRCGLVAGPPQTDASVAGKQHPDLTTLLKAAMDACRRARENDDSIVTEVIGGPAEKVLQEVTG